MRKLLNQTTSLIASVLRAGNGIKVLDGVNAFNRPKKIITLYNIEMCPFVRKVREATTMLDLDTEVKPCPKGGTRFRPEAVKIGGKAQFPFIVDPNTGVKMYESSDIIKYLFHTYGPGETKIPALLTGSKLATTLSMIATFIRIHPFNTLIPQLPRITPQALFKQEPVEHITIEKPIHIYNYEGSGHCRFVRETLDILEIPYIAHNLGKDSPKRKEFAAMSGKMQVPYLYDENTGKRMFESTDIVRYLYNTYSPRLACLSVISEHEQILLCCCIACVIRAERV